METAGFCDLKIETMGFSKTLLTEQTTGYHKVEGSNLMYICM